VTAAVTDSPFKTTRETDKHASNEAQGGGEGDKEGDGVDLNLV
jgi:hypothetical protein